MPSNAQVSNATFYIYQVQSNPQGDGPMGTRTFFMQRDWSVNSVTWNNANYLGGAVEGTGSIPAQSGFLTLNVTDVVRKWVKGEVPNYGVLVEGDETAAPGVGVSSTAAMGRRPRWLLMSSSNIPRSAIRRGRSRR